MKRIGWAVCVALCFVFAGCGSRTSDKELTQERYIERLRSEGYLGPTDTVRMFTSEEFAACMKQEGLVGLYSSLSPEMQRRAAVLYDVLFNSVVVRDNCWWLTCNRQTLVERGMPAVYYDLLVYNCWSMSESVNRWIAEGRMTPEDGNMERLFEELKTTLPFGIGADEAAEAEAEADANAAADAHVDAQPFNKKASETP